LSPVSLSPRAVDRLERRRVPVQSWYLDLSMVRNYWGEQRAYHHTAPINMLYALHEALRLVLDEGLENRWERHRRTSRGLVAGLTALGLEPRVPAAERLPQLITVSVPDGIDDAGTRRTLLERFGIEIGGGLGPMAGNTWRVGLMGASCTERNVVACLFGLSTLLSEQGHRASAEWQDRVVDAWSSRG
jgi:alanine-glyoxylate transaminase/serine-glyoxylate transaminase/serine-pyruvate transaminase